MGYTSIYEKLSQGNQKLSDKFILVAFNIIQLNWAAACHFLAPKTTAFQFFHSGLFHFNIISRNHAAPSRKDDICNEKGHRGVVLIRSGVHRFFKHPINLYSRFDLHCNYCHSIYVMTVTVTFDYMSICIICPSHFHIFPPGKNIEIRAIPCSPAHRVPLKPDPSGMTCISCIVPGICPDMSGLRLQLVGLGCG